MRLDAEAANQQLTPSSSRQQEAHPDMPASLLSKLQLPNPVDPMLEMYSGGAGGGRLNFQNDMQTTLPGRTHQGGPTELALSNHFQNFRGVHSSGLAAGLRGQEGFSMGSRTPHQSLNQSQHRLRYLLRCRNCSKDDVFRQTCCFMALFLICVMNSFQNILI